MPIITTQFPASISVTGLKGVNGFNITGLSNSWFGQMVSGAGDINDDGITDLVVCASGVKVIFGKSGIGGVGNFNLSNLNGANGFTFISASSSVSGAGDINNDGIADLVIGGNDGYIIFGKSGLGSSGSISPSALNGANGFSVTNIQSTMFVTGIGDINADGIDDLAIGATQAYSSAGAVYVIFGKSGIGSSGSLSVSTLNGANGFVIVGFPASSEGGTTISRAGDINDDGIEDLVVGAPFPVSSPYAGRAYVIFGKSGLGSSGSFNISRLTGSNGFTISGFSSDSYGGNSVSGIGDINADGIADLLVGAPEAGSGYVGISYAIFGKSGIGSSGSLSISSLNGANGFLITGYPASGEGGYSVSGVGDFNDDGVSDLKDKLSYSVVAL